MSSEAYAWVWLPGQRDPVVCGVLSVRGDQVDFTYGRSYRERPGAVALYTPELPLQAGRQEPLAGLTMAGVINDAGPDSWGQRVIDYRLQAARTSGAPPVGPLTYLLEAGSDRIGALDFQPSSGLYTPRAQSATLEDLARAAECVETGSEIPAALERALLGGSSVGGARPKALLTDGTRKLIAKFPSVTDTYPVERGEFVAMTLAARAGLNVAPVTLTRAMNRDILLVERFDRPSDGSRRMVVSALTIMGLSAVASTRDASYLTLAQRLREIGSSPKADLYELFARITFNILVGNTDDHARNTAAFWDGQQLRLTPAYDISPAPRGGGQANQAMEIGPGFRRSQLAGCIAAAGRYLLSTRQAQEIVEHQVSTIRACWDDVTDMGRMTQAEKDRYWGSAFLNPYVFYED